MSIGIGIGIGIIEAAWRGGRAVPSVWVSAKDPTHTAIGVVGAAALKDIRTGATVVTQTTGLRQPAYVSGARWDFTDDSMVMGAAPTVETVVMSVSATAPDNGFYGGLETGLNSRSYFGINANGKLAVGFGDMSWTAAGYFSNVTVPSGFYTLVVEIDGTTKRCRMFLNGTLILNAVATGEKFSGLPFLGAINNVLAPSAIVYGAKSIREFLRFSSILSDVDRVYYQNLIAVKWA